MQSEQETRNCQDQIYFSVETNFRRCATVQPKKGNVKRLSKNQNAEKDDVVLPENNELALKE